VFKETRITTNFTKEPAMGNKQPTFLPPELKGKLIGLSEDFRELWLKMDRSSTKSAISLGQKLLDGKKLVREIYHRKKGVWAQFRKEYFGDIGTRTSQRYMKLARHIDIDRYPRLAYLQQATLYRLIKFAKYEKSGVGEILIQNKIRVKGKPGHEDQEELANFKKKAAALVTQKLQKGMKRDKFKRPAIKSPGKSRTPRDNGVMSSIKLLIGWIDSISSEKDFEKEVSNLIEASLKKLRAKIGWFFKPHDNRGREYGARQHATRDRPSHLSDKRMTSDSRH
jgi:hypothetical protein